MNSDHLTTRSDNDATAREDAGFFLRDSHLNDLQIASIARLVDAARGMHMADVKIRKNGEDHWFQADWLKHIVRIDGTTAEAQAGHALEEYQSVIRCLDHYGAPKYGYGGHPLSTWGRICELIARGLPPDPLQNMSDSGACEAKP